MSRNSKKDFAGSLVALLLGLVVAKGGWSIIDFRSLPKKGVDTKQKVALKPLYYHYNLASKKEVVKPIVHKKPPKVVKIPKPVKKQIIPEKIESFLFKGLYNSNKKKYVVIEYLGKSVVLGLGEKLEGYKLVNLKGTVATFQKGSKLYKLDLYKNKEQKSTSRSASKSSITPSTPKQSKEIKKREQQATSQAAALSPHKEGETTIIPRDLFDRYRTNLRQIQKSINAVPYMVDGKLEGFRVNYIKKGSDFSKLGIQKGDIIIAVNGEPLNNLKVPIEFFKNLDTMTAATFTIKRGNEIKELEYEVR